MLWTIKGCLSKGILLWFTDQVCECSLNARLPSGCWSMTLGRPVLYLMEQHLIGEGMTGSDNLRLFFKELKQALTSAACILKLAQYREAQHGRRTRAYKFVQQDVFLLSLNMSCLLQLRTHRSSGYLHMTAQPKLWYRWDIYGI